MREGRGNSRARDPVIVLSLLTPLYGLCLVINRIEASYHPPTFA